MTTQPKPEWKIRQDHMGIYLDTGTGTSRWECTEQEPTEGDYANARLIEAAQGLLAAAKLLLAQEANLAGECGWCFQSPFGECQRPTCPGVIARAAIAIARGEKEGEPS